MHEKAKSNFACFHEHQTQLVATSLVFVETVALFSPPLRLACAVNLDKRPQEGLGRDQRGQ
ncbi:MAG: hypothetical protein DRG71_01410 [Deltaproteobacteria bacterium]|nr:MAG: hypothetical protein DRG71_01410 [Deltaproteobacteria bacterium]